MLQIGSLRVPRQDLAILLGLSAFLYATKLPNALPYFFSPDDVVQYHDQHFSITHLASHYVSQGRFGLAALYAALRLLGISPPQSNAMLAVLAIALLALCGLLAARVWQITGSVFLSILAGGLIFSHPYQSDHWYYRFMPIFLSTSMVLVYTGIWLAKTDARRLILASLLILLSLSIFQVTLSHALILSLAGLAIDLVRSQSPVRAALRAWIKPIMAILLGALGYLLINKLILGLSHVRPEIRSTPLATAEFSQRLGQAAILVSRLFVHDPALGGGLLQYLLLSLGALCLSLAIWARARRRISTPALVLWLAAMITAALSIFSWMLPLKVWWPSPRTLTGLGVFWAGVLVLSFCLAATASALRKAILATGIVVLFSFVGINGRVLSEQLRINSRDRLLANRILARLEQEPNFNELSRLVFDGHRYQYPDISTTTYDLNISIVAIQWAQTDFMREISGFQLQYPEAADVSSARAFCERAPKWPSVESVIIREGLGVVCF